MRPRGAWLPERSPGVTEYENLRINTAPCQAHRAQQPQRDLDAVPRDISSADPRSPRRPHICEELWSRLGHSSHAHEPSPWSDASLLVEGGHGGHQVNGKVKARISLTLGHARRPHGRGAGRGAHRQGWAGPTPSRSSCARRSVVVRNWSCLKACRTSPSPRQAFRRGNRRPLPPGGVPRLGLSSTGG